METGEKLKKKRKKRKRERKTINFEKIRQKNAEEDLIFQEAIFHEHISARELFSLPFCGSIDWSRYVHTLCSDNVKYLQHAL